MSLEANVRAAHARRGSKAAVKSVLRSLVGSGWGRHPIGGMTVHEYTETVRPTYAATIVTIYPSEHITEPLPRASDGTADTWRFRSYQMRESAEAFVAQIQNGQVIGSRGAIMTPERILLTDVSREFGPNQHSLFERIRLPAARRIDGPVAVLATDGPTTYYHWVFDILPRIHLLRRAGVFDQVEHFIVPELTRTYQSSTLKLAGVPEEKLIEAKGAGFAIQASDLFVPSLPSKLGVIEGWACRYLRDLFLPQEPSKRSGPQKIYISRSDANIRRLTHDGAFQKLLRQRGYTEIIASEMSFVQQINLFAGATHIVGPHGAGFTNILFSRPETSVLDIFPASFVIPCYWILSNRLGLNYHCYADGPVEKPFAPYWDSTDRDIVMDDRITDIFEQFDGLKGPLE